MRSIKLRNTPSASALLALLSLLSLLSLDGCSRFTVENELPEAKVQLLMNGMPVNIKDPIPFMGAPLTFTLDGSMSSDDDGTIVKFLWLDSDAPPSARYDAGIMDLNTFTGDPMPAPSPQVTLGEGHHQFSLWVTDDEGAISAPATLEFTIETPSVFMPDPACKMTYMSAIPECVDCVCTPTAMKGCLDNYNACYLNPDPMFVTLCKAIVDCAREKSCVSTACYTPALCGPQIDAAAAYNGGVLADCQSTAPTNPCAASAQLGACTSLAMGACVPSCTN
jgi:hypothetical protein